MSFDAVEEFLSPMFSGVLHSKRVLSLVNAVRGTVQATSLSVSAIGRGLASVADLEVRHAIKQVDRWVGNAAFQPWQLADTWVRHLLRNRDEVVINLDWTEFDGDGQTTLMAAAQTWRGRALPLIWKTYNKSRLKDNRNAYEDEVLQRLREIIPPEIRVTIVADRGFCDQKLFAFLDELGFGYIIRLRSNITVTNAKGEARPASEWVGKGGRLQALKGAKITKDEFEVGQVVVVRDKGMKETWCLVTSLKDLPGSAVKKSYGKRFSIEELFRDFKDMRLGMGLSWTKVSRPLRRDRLLFLAMLAHELLTKLGEAGEVCSTP